MKKLDKKPIKSSLLLAVIAILASVVHNVIFATTQVEEPFFFTISIVSALSIPVVVIVYLINKFTDS